MLQIFVETLLGRELGGVVAAFALWEIAVHDRDRMAIFIGESAPDEAALGVFVIAGKTFVHAQRFLAREQGHAVMAFLTVVVDVIAQGLHFGEGELLVMDFGFLQANHIGLMLFNQRRQLMRAGA